MRVEEPENANFARLFDRSGEYAALLVEVDEARATLGGDASQDALRSANSSITSTWVVRNHPRRLAWKP